MGKKKVQRRRTLLESVDTTVQTQKKSVKPHATHISDERWISIDWTTRPEKRKKSPEDSRASNSYLSKKRRHPEPIDLRTSLRNKERIKEYEANLKLEAENNRELQRKVNSLHEKLKSEKEIAQNARTDAAQLTQSNWTKDTKIADLQMKLDESKALLSEQKRMCNCRILSAQIEEIKKQRQSDQSKFAQFQAEMKSKLEKERKMFQNKTSEDLKDYGLKMAKRDMIIHQQNEQLKKQEDLKEQLSKAESKISELCNKISSKECELQNLKNESEAKSRKIEEQTKELCTSGHALMLVGQMSAECGQKLIKDNAISV